eukprot:jgi/Tetstr1/445555/TSEL_033328.t1
MTGRLQTREELDPKRVQTYYNSLTEGLPVAVLPTREGGGYGLFATRDIASGEVIFTEKALAGMQQAENRAFVLACAHCHRFTGSLALQAGLLGSKISRAEIAGKAIDNSNLPDVSYLQPGQNAACSADAAKAAATEAAVIPCPAGCGEVYCSQACLEADSSNGHALLCTGPIDDADHPLVRFKGHACETNDIFLLAGRALARAIQSWKSNGRDAEAATLPLRCFHGRPWWDAVAAGDSNPELRQQCQQLVADSVGLFKEALVALGHWDDALASFVNEEFFSRLVGTFELNNIGIQMRSPLKAAIDSAMAGDNENVPAQVAGLLEGLEQAAQAPGHDHHHSQDDSDDGSGGGSPGDSAGGDSGDPPESDDEDSAGSAELGIHSPDTLGFFDGTGLYALACMMNHSCLPSVKLLYPEDGRGTGVARVVALSDLLKGEEVYHSYLDVKWPFPRRRRTLERSYGFVCACQRCSSEQ